MPLSPTSAEPGELVIRFVGHSTVLLDMDGTRVLTDPVLRNVFPLQRHGPSASERDHDIDLVLISHAHQDHLDIPSLRRLTGEPLIVVPAGLEGVLYRGGIRNVQGVRVGDAFVAGDGVRVLTVQAVHDGNRPPMGPRADAIGFMIEGTSAVYFAGDTDLFPDMERLGDAIDVALLPVWGWGPYLGPGHLNPRTAAVAAAMVGARVSIPIHWGTLFPRGFHRVWPTRLTAPPVDFAQSVVEQGIRTEVRILRPGEETLVLATDVPGPARITRSAKEGEPHE
jgi:L-ascorbate metabolism protein UlaG (beta-lactamase superfamily)